MQINNLQEQKILLGKAYVKNYDKLFEKYMDNLTKEENTKIKEDISNTFYSNRKKLNNEYERELYKIEIQESPSTHTMYSAVNYKQKILIDNMNDILEKASKELAEKIANPKYGFFEKIEFQAEYDELKERLKDDVAREVRSFRQDYYQALKSRNNSKIDKLEQSLLTNMLSEL